MNIFSFSITANFYNTINLDNFNLRMSHIYPELYNIVDNINVNDDIITIIFQIELNDIEQNKLYTFINEYDPKYNFNNKILLINKSTNLKYYYKLTSFLIKKKHEEKIFYIKLLSNMEPSNTGYKVKLFNLTNNNIIYENEFINSMEQINVLRDFINLPDNESIIELHVKSNLENKNVYIKSLTIEYIT